MSAPRIPGPAGKLKALKDKGLSSNATPAAVGLVEVLGASLTAFEGEDPNELCFQFPPWTTALESLDEDSFDGKICIHNQTLLSYFAANVTAFACSYSTRVQSLRSKHSRQRICESPQGTHVRG